MPKKTLLLLTFLPLVSFFHPTFAYNKEQLSKFQKTSQCPSCDLSSADLTFHYANFSSCVLAKSNLTQSRLNGVFSYCDFTETNASGANLGGNYSDANFSNARLIRTNFTYTNLSDADFTNALTLDADFSGANLYNAKITETQLKTARSVCNAVLPDGSKGTCK